MSALHTAIQHNRLQQIRLLLDVGINVNLRDKQGRTPLMMVCFFDNKHTRKTVTQLLLAYGADVDAKDNCGKTVLTHACICGNDFLADVILKHTDMDLNCTDEEGNSCLMHAAINGHPKVIRLLLKYVKTYGLSVDIRNNKGFTAYLLALKHGNFHCAKILKEEGNASVNIFDFERYWTGEKWAQSYHAQRPESNGGYTSSNCRGRRAQSTKPTLLRREVLSTPIRRPKSTPPTFKSYTQCETDRKALTVKANLPLITEECKISSSSRSAKHKGGQVEYHRLNRPNTTKIHQPSDLIDIKMKNKKCPSASRCKQSFTSITERSWINPCDQKTCTINFLESVGEESWNETTHRSDSERESDSSSEEDIEESQGNRRPVSQRYELITLFEQYSLSQVPIPKAASGHRRIFRKISQNSVSSSAQMCVQEQARGRKMITVRSKTRENLAGSSNVERRSSLFRKTVLEKLMFKGLDLHK